MTRRLILIRHGRVDFSSQEMTISPRGRQWDPPLDDLGRDQARRLAARLLAMDPPAGVFVSPLARCRQTAEPFLAGSGLQAEVVEDLGEVFIGAWEGVRFEDILAADAELARRFREQEAIFTLAPGAESGEELRARVVPAVEAILERSPDGTVLVVTHGGVINAYVGHIMGVRHDMFFLPENASMNWVWIDGDAREMRFLNDIGHLADRSRPEPKEGAPPTDGA